MRGTMGRAHDAYDTMYPDFSAKKGWYSPQELGHLANALGFPRLLFVSAFKVEIEVLGETAIKEKTLLDLLKSKALDSKLERMYNRYDAKYNSKLITRSIALLRHRSLTFQELSNARVSFETYACEDGTGMPAELATVQQALKLVSRTMSPVKLHHEIQKCLKHSEAPYRFQMYEFFDIVPMCETFDQAENRFHKILCDIKGLSKPGINADIDLPDFGRLLTTTEQQIVAFLDEEYKASLYHETESCSPIENEDDDCVIDSELRMSLVSNSREEFSSISTSIRNSTTQLQLARSGHSPFTEGQYISFSKSSTPLLSLRRTCAQQKPLSFNFKAQPKSKMTKASSKIVALGAHATGVEKPNALMGPSGDFDTLCTTSVLKAWETLVGSFALVPPTPIHKISLSKAGPSICSTKARDTSKPYCIEPLITDRDKVVHQGLINDLEWRAQQKRIAWTRTRGKM